MSVAEIIAKELNVEPSAIHSATRLDSLGLDSLEFLELIQQVEMATGHKFSDELIANAETVADLEKESA